MWICWLASVVWTCTVSVLAFDWFEWLYKLHHSVRWFSYESRLCNSCWMLDTVGLFRLYYFRDNHLTIVRNFAIQIHFIELLIWFFQYILTCEHWAASEAYDASCLRRMLDFPYRSRKLSVCLKSNVGWGNGCHIEGWRLCNGMLLFTWRSVSFHPKAYVSWIGPLNTLNTLERAAWNDLMNGRNRYRLPV